MKSPFAGTKELPTDLLFPAQFDTRFSKRVFPIIGTIITVAFCLAGLALIWAVRQGDEAAVRRQLHMTERSISATVKELAEQQEVVAVWDEPVQKLRGDIDPNWLDENIGVWLNRTYGQNQVYILDSKDKPIYAVIDGTRGEPAHFNQVLPDLDEHLKELRLRPSLVSQAEADAGGAKTHLTSGRAVYDAHFLRLVGRPAAVSAMRIVPHSDAIAPTPGAEPILVSVRFLDGDFLTQLASRNLIEGLRFSASNLAAPGEVSVPLRSDTGSLIGYFLWKPDTPGSRILDVIGPVSALVTGVVFVLMGLVLRWLAGALRTLEAKVIELRASEKQAQHLAFHDVLTGLPNRARLDERLDQALARAQRGEKVAVLMIDLDRFKHVNDTLGHYAGDSLIKEFAHRLSSLLKPGDIVARLGGDEFAIVQTGFQDDRDVQDLCERILSSVHKPFEVLGHPVFVGASVGIALAPEFGFDRTEIMRKADIALYRAKDEGRDCYRLFTAAMDETVKVRSLIEDDLRRALDQGEGLDVAFQPQVAAAGQPVVGLEALVRWRHPIRGAILPEQFIPVAEQTGLIAPLGDWVLRQACLASKRWPGLYISVNLSPVQFRNSDFAERVIAIARECGADPHTIELEITESVLLDEGGETADVLATLRKAGFRIALDDFGTGYSSLGYLHRYPVDKIKIDRSFVRNLGRDANATAIVKAIVALGKALDLTVTAEGVETENQYSFLGAAGCNEMQGYLFSHPLPSEQITRLLAGWTTPRTPLLPAVVATSA